MYNDNAEHKKMFRYIIKIKTGNLKKKSSQERKSVQVMSKQNKRKETVDTNWC